jgi:hypothetical protein
MAGASLNKHYDAVAASYQKAWFYEDGTDYQQWLARQLAVSVARVPVQSSDRPID